MSKLSFVILSTTEGRVYLTHTATYVVQVLYEKVIKIATNVTRSFTTVYKGESDSPTEKYMRL
jgi:hypothetical protein